MIKKFSAVLLIFLIIALTGFAQTVESKNSDNGIQVNTDLNYAYSRLSYWQLYVKYSFFRETNYEPEVFIRHTFSDFFHVTTGAVHQSNGVGDIYERAWNRVYPAGTLKKNS